MNIEQMKNFLVLCETMNFRLASEKIYIAQPALSRQIQVLEEYLGVLLFDRLRKQIKLTSAGKYFQKECNRWIQHFENILDHVKEIHRGGQGQIIIGHSNSALQTVLPTFITKLKKKLPKLKFVLRELSNKEILDSLASHEIDFGLGPNINFENDIEGRIVYKENFALLLPAQHKLLKSK